MKRLPIALAAFGVLFVGAPVFCATAPSSEAVREVGEEYLALLVEQSPLLALRLGLEIRSLPDITVSAEERRAEKARGLLSKLSTLQEQDLGHEDALSCDVLRRQLHLLEDAPRYHAFEHFVTPYASPIGGVNALFQALPIQGRSGTERYLRLLRQYPRLVDSIRGSLGEATAKGFVIPQEEIDTAVAFLGASIGNERTSPYAVEAQRIVGIPDSEAEAFRKEVSTLVEGEVNPALERLKAFVSGDYRRKAPPGVGFGQYPGGLEYYRWLVSYHTTLDVAPEEVHAIGLKEVARVEEEMHSVRESLGFRGTFVEFKEAIRKDPRFFPATPEAIGERLMVYVHRIEPRVDEFFSKRPRAPYGVKRLAPELEGGQTFGYYQEAPTREGTGYYRFNGSNLADRSLLNAGGLIYHELIPGHHFQINLALENESLPRFRRESADTAYTEGWGEYASMLAGEMGMYSDPYDRYGRLSMEMFLSVRLVVDTGMNALGWSRQKAVAYMKDHLMETDTQIATESLRYSCDIPGQALAYKMGARRIRELREEARTSLGTRFDIRRFHEALLGSGSLPMPTLERHVRWFIEREKAR